MGDRDPDPPRTGRSGDILDLTEDSRRLRGPDAERERFLAKLLEAEERERRRLAHDIHDDPLQAMTAVHTGLTALWRAAPPELRERIGRLEEMTRDAVARLRRVLFDVRPPELDRRGLVSTLRDSLELLQSHTGIRCGLRSRLPQEPRIEHRIVLFRIASEALANVRKHAEATRVDVLLEQRGGGIRLRIRDDGKGFHPHRVAERPGHLGLEVIHERADLAGGRLEVASAPGEGTTIDCWIPTAGRRRRRPAR